MIVYDDFISQNTAIEGAKRIGIYKNGNRVGYVPLGNLKADKGKKIYSFGVVSDIHTDEDENVYKTNVEDCKKAFKYYNNNPEIDFLCICGDLSENGTKEELLFYKSLVDTYIPDKPVYVAVGNHEDYNNKSAIYEEVIGSPLYYTFEHKNDVFIMFGIRGTPEYTLFDTEGLDWLEDVLEKNKDKRCYLFLHNPTSEGCGGAFDFYTGTQLGTHENSVKVKEMLSTYKNIIHFHGHSHFKFELQEYTDLANYDNIFGSHSVHIPSLTVLRGVDLENSKLTSVVEQSQGYIVDVYENGIHLNGYDFINDKFIPIASYWLEC